LEGPGVWQTLGKRKKKTRKKKGGGKKKGGRLESGKLWEEKKKEEYIHTHSYTQVVVHISMYDGEEA
jgi:hypothetical protein